MRLGLWTKRLLQRPEQAQSSDIHPGLFRMILCKQHTNQETKVLADSNPGTKIPNNYLEMLFGTMPVKLSKVAEKLHVLDHSLVICSILNTLHFANEAVGPTNPTPRAFHSFRFPAKGLSHYLRFNIGLLVVFSPELPLQMIFFFQHFAIFRRLFLRCFASICGFICQVPPEEIPQLLGTRGLMEHPVITNIFSELTTSFIRSLYAPRIKHMIWLDMQMGGEAIDLSCNRFMAALAAVYNPYEKRGRSCFLSSLITSILTYHRTWVDTIHDTEYNVRNTNISQFGVLMKQAFGQYAHHRVFVRCVIVGQGENVELLLIILSYFIRFDHIRCGFHGIRDGLAMPHFVQPLEEDESESEGNYTPSSSFTKVNEDRFLGSSFGSRSMVLAHEEDQQKITLAEDVQEDKKDVTTLREVILPEDPPDATNNREGEVSLSYALCAGLAKHFIPNMVLQAVTTKVKLHSLVKEFQHELNAYDYDEGHLIVGTVRSHDTAIFSAGKGDPFSGHPSHFITETLLQMIKMHGLGLSGRTCVEFMEDRLRELYRRVEALLHYINNLDDELENLYESTLDPNMLAEMLMVDISDIPLLFSIADLLHK